MSDYNEKLAECFKGVFPQMESADIPLASTKTTAEWDSVAQITLIAIVEEAFDIDVAPEEIEQLVSFELLLDFVKNKQ